MGWTIYESDASPLSRRRMFELRGGRGVVNLEFVQRLDSYSVAAERDQHIIRPSVRRAKRMLEQHPAFARVCNIELEGDAPVKRLKIVTAKLAALTAERQVVLLEATPGFADRVKAIDAETASLRAEKASLEATVGLHGEGGDLARTELKDYLTSQATFLMSDARARAQARRREVLAAISARVGRLLNELASLDSALYGMPLDSKVLQWALGSLVGKSISEWLARPADAPPPADDDEDDYPALPPVDDEPSAAGADDEDADEAPLDPSLDFSDSAIDAEIAREDAEAEAAALGGALPVSSEPIPPVEAVAVEQAVATAGAEEAPPPAVETAEPTTKRKGRKASAAVDVAPEDGDRTDAGE